MTLTIDHVEIPLNDAILTNEAPLNFIAGNMYLIKGASGSGKTSFLYQLGGISSQLKMHYWYYEKPIVDRDNFRKTKIGFMYQNMNLLNSLTVFDHMSLFASLNQQVFNEDIAQNLLNEVNLAVSLNQKIGTLSGGEKQRLSLACILAKNPEIIIVDEPTSALDKKNANHLMKVFRNLTDKYHKVVIIATHSNEYDDLADDILVIKNNKIKSTKNGEKNCVHIHQERKQKNNTNFLLKMAGIQFKDAFIKHPWQKLITLLVIGCTIVMMDISKYQASTYLEKLNETSSNHLVIAPDKNIDEEDINYISKIPHVVNVTPVSYGQCDVGYQNNDTKEVLVFHNFDENKQEYYFDSSFIKNINEQVLVNGKNVLVEKVMSDEEKQLYAIGDQPIIVIPQGVPMETEVKTGTYLVKVDSFSNVEQVMNKLQTYLPKATITSEYTNIQAKVKLIEMNAFYTKLTLAIINVITFIILCGVKIQESNERKKVLALFQANGLTKEDVMKMEVTSILFEACLYIVIGSVAAIFLPLKVYALIIMFLFIVGDIMLPGIMMTGIVIRSPIENTLRETQ